MQRDDEGDVDRHPEHPPPPSRTWLWVGAVGIVLLMVVIYVLAMLFTERDDPTQLIPTPIEEPATPGDDEPAPDQRDQQQREQGSLILPPDEPRSGRIETH